MGDDDAWFLSMTSSISSFEIFIYFQLFKKNYLFPGDEPQPLDLHLMAL